MVEIDATYEGKQRCRATHGPSGAVLETDAPRDNHGLGQSFSPTDLVATGLVTCMATIMGLRARERGWAIEGTKLHVEKVMTVAPEPRRIKRLNVVIRMPETTRELTAEDRTVLEHAANTCPVRLSILDAIEVPVQFHW